MNSVLLATGSRPVLAVPEMSSASRNATLRPRRSASRSARRISQPRLRTTAVRRRWSRISSVRSSIDAVISSKSCTPRTRAARSVAFTSRPRFPRSCAYCSATPANSLTIELRRSNARCQVELPEDVLDMTLDRVLGDRQRRGDLPVPQALRDVVENFPLATGEEVDPLSRAVALLEPAQLLDDEHRELAAERRLALNGSPERSHQARARDLFVEVAVGTCAQHIQHDVS